jgi:hypothetical protein
MQRISGFHPWNTSATADSPGAEGSKSKPPANRKPKGQSFRKSLRGRLSTRSVDLRYWFWKKLHSGSSFADYYARSISAKLEHGKTHKTLIGNTRAAEQVLHQLEESPGQRSRDLNYFEIALENGLRPEHTCIDYGCGSLRVGRHLIDYLDPGHYWGLDIVSDFYEAGKNLLPPGTLDEKRPELHVVSLHSILKARHAQPDFVFSFAVLKHVPPEELERFFANITALMGPETTAVITFSEAAESSRIGTKIWEYSADDLLESMRLQGAGFVCTVTPRRPNMPVPRKSILTIRRAEV